MPDFRKRARTVSSKVEATPGTHAGNTVGADAVKVSDPVFNFTPDLEQTGEVTRALDDAAQIAGGGIAPGTFGAVLHGSGTGGTAPELGSVLQGCGLSETLLAADVADTAQAGAAGSITLAAGDVSADDDFIGNTIEITGGTGVLGEKRVITDSVASTDVCSVHPDWTTPPDVTTTYKIRASALYVPASTSLKNLSLDLYKHNTGAGNDILEQILGAAGNGSFTFPNRKIARASFNFQGKFVAPTDVSDPGVATYDTTKPPPIKSALWYLDGVVVKPREMSVDLGNQVSSADDPADAFGVDVAGIVSRKISGRINPPLTNVATRDVLTDLIAGNEKKCWLSWGGTDGNRISVYMPTLRYTGREDADVDGFASEGIPFDCGGIDNGFYLCFE